MCLCVCVHVCVSVHVRTCVSVHFCVHAHVCMGARACMCVYAGSLPSLVSLEPLSSSTQGPVVAAPFPGLQVASVEASTQCLVPAQETG